MRFPSVSSIVIVGEPRSGTTWLGKIFDSHPEVFHLHEPDFYLPRAALPPICRRDEIDAYVRAAQLFLQRVETIKRLSTVGSLPFFAKSYRSTPMAILRNVAIFGLHPCVRLDRRFGGLIIPDLLDPARADRRRTVIKSIKSCGRTGLLAAAMEGGHIVFLVRHPCGQIASSLRGFATGKFRFATSSVRDPTADLAQEILTVERAAEHDLQLPRLKAMPIVELLAWHWALLNQKVLDDMAGDGRLHIVSYEGLCARPLETTRRLFDEVGLDWRESTAAFLRKSTTYRGPTRYYGVMRNTAGVVDRWRQELEASDQSRIIEIAERFPVAHLAL